MTCPGFPAPRKALWAGLAGGPLLRALV